MKILIVDDEANISELISKFLKLENYKTELASNGLSAKRLLENEVFDLAVIDLKMPGMDGMELLKWISTEGPDVPVIMISAFGEINDAVAAMKLGAKDYIVKPFDPEELIIKIKRVFEEKILIRKIEAGKNSIEADEFIGEAKEIKEIKELILKVSDTISSIIIIGESGTGKEILAGTIHKNSTRKNGPFIPINIGAIPENLLESELFGYEKGAFTGAVEKKLGLFEIANNGTLFLDEIGEMTINIQVKLLRVLQDKKISRLGGTQLIPIDVRFICATNKNLESLISEKKFREDLFFRLNVIRIKLPPLRERKEDIPLLIGHFIKKFNKIMRKSIKQIEPEVLIILQNYSFPGNIRELENIIERAFIYCEKEIITKKDIDIKFTNENKMIKTGTLKKNEKEMIISSLHKWEGNKTKAAKELGFTRRTLLNKIKEYDIKFYKQVEKNQ